MGSNVLYALEPCLILLKAKYVLFGSRTHVWQYCGIERVLALPIMCIFRGTFYFEELDVSTDDSKKWMNELRGVLESNQPHAEIVCQVCLSEVWS